ncbi:DNA-directed RNA polymerase sigma-70 factor [Haloferula helveola]|uniref:DNA-directed RNA polymerase sigma-70 factor n=1 Tax=Haloferula helveola TaxID=490095 RepID=A0ABN6GZT4_9BACT|nr:DNA-directed RNA polymerase sigma-70 factor [Haloferula helveola]
MDPRSSKDDEIVQLLVKHQNALRAFLVSLMPGRTDMEDVMQETSLVIWQKRDEFEPGTEFKAWMFSVARFRVMAYWRDQKRRRESAMPEELLNRLAEQAAEEGFEGIEKRSEFLGECIQSLRPEDRALVLRRHLAGAKPGQLAEEMGRTSNSVRVSLHRIRSILRHCIRRRTHLAEGGAA